MKNIERYNMLYDDEMRDLVTIDSWELSYRNTLPITEILNISHDTNMAYKDILKEAFNESQTVL